MTVVTDKPGRLGPMYSWNTGSRLTNGATANFGVGSYPPTATPVPVAAVSGYDLVAFLGSIHFFPQQAHPLGDASGFAPAAHYSSPVSTHVSLGNLSMHSRVIPTNSTDRCQHSTPTYYKYISFVLL